MLALVGSAYHGGEFFDNIASYGMVIFDECHHAASSQAQAVLNKINSKYVYGLSATPGRSDRLDDIVFMMLGPMRHKYTARQQADEQGIGRLLVPRFTRVINITGEQLDINKADSFIIIESKVRNEQIVSDVVKSIAHGRTPLVLTKRWDMKILLSSDFLLIHSKKRVLWCEPPANTLNVLLLLTRL